jgi:ankyrin repeat protein
MMIDNGANVNCQNGNGETPLHLAGLACNLNAADALLKSKAKLDLLTQHAS